LTTSIGISAAVAGAGAILAWFLIAAARPEPTGGEMPEPAPEPGGEAAPVAPGLARGLAE